MPRQLHSLDAERAVICAVIVGGEKAFDRAELHASSFYDLRHRAIWDSMAALRARGEPPGDPLLLERELGERLEASGGLAYLTEIALGAAVPENAHRYAEAVRETSFTRDVVTKLSELLSSDLDGRELVGRLSEIQGLLSRGVSDAAIEMRQAVIAAWDLLAEVAEGKKDIFGISTGFPDLDQMLGGGLQKKKITILAGRSSMGKSALCRSIADNINAAGRGVHSFTPEDTTTTLALRTMADHARVDLHRLRTVQLSGGDMRSIGTAVKSLALRSGWLLDDTSGISGHEVAMRVRKHKDDNKTELVTADYVQLFYDSSVPAHEEMLQINAAMRVLIDLAKTEDVAVLALSQLNRDCEKRKPPKPILSDLRQSGRLEQDAECVMFVYRDEYYNPETDKPGITEVLVRKNKNGRTGTVELTWDAETATHRSKAPEHYEHEQQDVPF